LLIEFILLCAVAGLAVWLFRMRDDVKRLQWRIDALEDADFHRILSANVQTADVPPSKPDREPVPAFKVAAKATPRRKAAVVSSDDFPPPPTPTPDYQPPEPEPEQEPAPRFKNPLAGASFEDLVGGKLPIWIGGIALVFAGFFLVRYTIEAGLLGPAARSIIATLFALLLIALSEFGGRLPKVGDAFTADPRVGQSLAGAGVATLYGTLYMASEIYGLFGVMTAFALVIVVTAIAFALSLRRGPPTALMGLAGGFAAPWVAGLGASNLPTLLLYLAVFIAALFGLAIWRRWLWLLVLASGGGAIWSFAMLVSAEDGLAWLGLFILVCGAAAVFALDRFKDGASRWSDLAAYAPMGLALVQLTMLLPRMEFSPVAWGLYGALSLLAVVMAWRETKMALVMLAAMLLPVIPLAESWGQRGGDATSLIATFGYIALFAGAGHWAIRQQRAPLLGWALAAIGAPVLAWFAASLPGSTAYPDYVWGIVALAAAGSSAWLAWQEQQQARTGIVQRLASAASVLMLLMAGLLLVPDGWMPVWSAGIALATAAWAKVTQDRVVRGTANAPLGIAILWGAGASWMLLNALGAALMGDSNAYTLLPPFADAVRATLLPALLILGLLWQRWFLVGARTRLLIWSVAGGALAAFLWMIAKQPAAIQSPSDFIRLGFAERAIFTQILFALGWLALAQAAQRPAWPALRSIGWALVAIALFRVVWFDLALLNPVLRAQMVGPVPVANLATGHFAIVAIWLWLLSAQATTGRNQLALHIGSLTAMILTVLATVRQAMQGSLLSGGDLGTGENYLYSAALLALAIAWLSRGMVAKSRLMRLAGLALLTAVTFKVFLIDAAALSGVLRILSFLVLGVALIGIGWAYGRLMGRGVKVEQAAT
jgi:uncharacterized membrane protein